MQKFTLKTIKPRHRAIARMLVTGVPPQAIAEELSISTAYLSLLQQDPMFQEALGQIEADAHETWKSTQKKAMEVLDEAALESATLVADSVGGLVKQPIVTSEGAIDMTLVEVPLKDRINSAWDVLNRTGNKVVEKQATTVISIQELIIQAFAARQGQEAEDVRKLGEQDDVLTISAPGM